MAAILILAQTDQILSSATPHIHDSRGKLHWGPHLGTRAAGVGAAGGGRVPALGETLQQQAGQIVDLGMEGALVGQFLLTRLSYRLIPAHACGLRGALNYMLRLTALKASGARISRCRRHNFFILGWKVHLLAKSSSRTCRIASYLQMHVPEGNGFQSTLNPTNSMFYPCLGHFRMYFNRCHQFL